jgi:2-deoxy-D-gluconate 3-dehydrogenase
VPSDNWGLPDDFAGITIFLASAALDFVTGTAIPLMTVTQ